MNPDQSAREEIEAKLTALLLGELPEEEAKLLRWAISQDPQLEKLHEELKLAIGLVREVASQQPEPNLAENAALKLSESRRQKLLAHFKTPRTKPLFWLKRIDAPTLVIALAVVAIVAMLAAISLPNFVKARNTSKANEMLNQVRTEEAKEEQLALENKKTPQAATAAGSLNENTDGVYSQNIVGYINIAPPAEVASANSTLNPVTTLPHQPKTDIVLPQPQPASTPAYAFGGGVAGNGGSGGGGGIGGAAAREARLPADERSAAGAPIPQPVEDGPQIVTTSELKKAPAPPPTTEIVLPQPQPASMPTFAFGGGVAGNGGGGGGGGGGVSTTFAFATPPPASSSPGSPASISGKIIESPAPVASGASTFAQRLNSIYVRRPVDTRRDWNANQALSDNSGTALQQTENQQGHFALEGDSSQEKRFLAVSPPVSPTKDNAAPGFAFPHLEQRMESVNAYFQNSEAAKREAPKAELAPQAPKVEPPSATASTISVPDIDPNTGLPSGGAIAVGSLAPVVEQPKVAPPPTQVPAMPPPPQAIAGDLETITAGPSVISRADRLNAPAINQTGASVVTNAVPIATSEAWAPAAVDEDRLTKTSPPPAPVFTPEIQTSSNSFSTFAMNVSDVSFKLAEARLQNGPMPDAASIRSEEFVNAFDYRDPEAQPGVAVAFTSERARDPFAHNCDLLRFSIKTAASGRAADRPLNLVLLLDNSGSMERADRVAIIRAALRVLGAQLHPRDTVSVVTFARTARLWVDGVSGDQAGAIFDEVGGLTPQGGTNLEEAMRLAYATARRHYLANGMNRVVLLTDGAANLGNVDPNALKQKVETNRRQGIALDCFGIGWEDYNDDLLELLSSNGDGRYAFLNSPDDVSNEFAAKLAGALQVAAEDVKVQVEFNPARVTAWRQIGYASHQLSQEQFRDNTVAAGAIAAREAGNALYTVRVNPQGDGPLATVRVRYRIPGTTEVREQAWDVAYTGGAVSLEQSSAAMRLAAVAGEFAEWLEASPSAQEVTPDELLRYLSGTPETYGADPRPKQLEWMIRQAQSLSGK